jgi:hypothetical protein
MIAAHEVVPLLREVAPGFEPVWQAERAWWRKEEPGRYIETGWFARYLVDAFAEGRTAEFPAAFETIERILRDGDQEARDLAGIGVLEDIQTIASWRPFGSGPFFDWLAGPLSRDCWRYLDALWKAAGGSLMDVARYENRMAARRRRSWWRFWR